MRENNIAPKSIRFFENSSGTTQLGKPAMLASISVSNARNPRPRIPSRAICHTTLAIGGEERSADKTYVPQQPMSKAVIGVINRISTRSN